MCDDTLTPVGSYEMTYASNHQTNVRTKQHHTMKKLLLLFLGLAITGFATACHDHDRDRHTPITTTTTTEETSTHIAPSSTSSTVVHSY